MKVLAVILVVLGTTSAGSGPYLPSGWRPQGPAFLLPNEVTKPPVPLKDVPLQVEEASGSETLREYGPPKEVSQDFTLQLLPEVVTEQSFVIIKSGFGDEEADAVTEEVSINTEEKLNTQEVVETATETLSTVETAEQSAAVIQGKSIEVQNEESVQVSKEETAQTNDEIREAAIETNEVKDTESVVLNVEGKIEKQIEEVSAAVEGVKNIADALVTLENEVTVQQAEAIQEVEAKSVQETSGNIQAPEGFLEYGPPGFTEYGPPKQDILRSGNLVENLEEKSGPAPVEETNEARRRRFSPRFKQTVRRAHH